MYVNGASQYILISAPAGGAGATLSSYHTYPMDNINGTGTATIGLQIQNGLLDRKKREISRLNIIGTRFQIYM